jgi:1-acyl-sn-glycerol-3-phosphate acyltransferase
MSASPQDAKARERLAAMRGENTPISIAGWLRLVARSLAMIALLIVFTPLHYIFRMFAYGSPFPKYFLKYVAWIVGARVERKGTPLRRDVVFVSNHVSWIDILALAGASGTAFVAKHELSQVPIIGWLCRLNRTVFVKRENRLGVAEQINALREALVDNWSVTIFPEGTTTDGQSLLPFKTSMLSVLEPPPMGVLVQPILLDYGAVAEELGWVGEESGLNNAKRVLSRRGSFPLKISFLEPFSPEDHRGRKAIGKKARVEIETALLRALGKPLRDFEHTVPPVQYQPPTMNAPQAEPALSEPGEAETIGSGRSKPE